LEENKNNTYYGLVSIIIPNFNSQRYIKETIQSIYSQTYGGFEIIIVDDNSSDNSVNFIKGFDFIDDRLKLFVLKKNNGRPSIPRNYGLQKAQGDFIAFMDSDDIWHHEKLAIQLAAMSKYKADFSCTSLINFSNYIELSSRPKIQFYGKVERLSFKKLLRKNIIPNSSVIVSRSRLIELRFNEDARYKAIEDYHLWLQLLQQGISSIKLKDSLLFYRISETSISQHKLQMLKKNFMLLSEFKINDKPLGVWVYMYMVSYIFYSLLRVARQKM
jgi:teichuronic acid biosynthesis glycosyltransferase TuaG